MKTPHHKQFGNVLHTVQPLILALIASVAASCASTGSHKNDVAAEGFQMAVGEVEAENHTLEATIGALKEFVTQPGPDLREQFHRFSSALDRLAALSRRNEAAAARLERRNKAYFDAWDKELATMNFEVVRGRSEARKTEVVKDFDNTDRRYHDAQAALAPLVDYLRDIRKALSTDLTPSGVSAMKSIVSRAEENAGKVQTALTKLAADLNNSAVKMSSLAVQNVPVGDRRPAPEDKRPAPERPARLERAPEPGS